jgi:hypothetical protein
MMRIIRFPVAGSILLIAVVFATPSQVDAQFSDPCGVGCAATLLLDSYVVASGTAVVVGRSMGGFSRVSQGVLSWGSGFAMTTAAGIALQGDGDRQRRATYGGAIGGAVGGLIGLGLEAAIGGGTNADRLSSTLIGAGIGVLVGGLIGAVTLDGIEDPTPTPLFSLRLPL